MTTLDDFVDLARSEQFLVVVSTGRADGTIQSSLVNAGVMAHPVSGTRVVAFVTYGPAKLRIAWARGGSSMAWSAAAGPLPDDRMESTTSSRQALRSREPKAVHEHHHHLAGQGRARARRRGWERERRLVVDERAQRPRAHLPREEARHHEKGGDQQDGRAPDAVGHFGPVSARRS